ncbi:hypothetical protein DJICPGNB_25895 [Escherichia coli]|nr:hypothetical protein DJICPGNB_25895 [Escherichia coli]
MVPNSKAEKFEKMAEGTAKDKDQSFCGRQHNALSSLTLTSYLACVGAQTNAIYHLRLNRLLPKIGVMFWRPTTIAGGISPKVLLPSVCRLGASVMKDGKEDQLRRGAECQKQDLHTIIVAVTQEIR